MRLKVNSSDALEKKEKEKEKKKRRKKRKTRVNARGPWLAEIVKVTCEYAARLS